MGHGSRSRRRDEAEGDDTSDAAREEAREKQREHKHRQRRRKIERRHAAVNEILSRIAPPSRASFTALEDVPAWCDGNPIEWSSIGPSCDPASMANDGEEATMRGDDANKGASAIVAAAAKPPVVNLRAMRKRWQVESFAVVLRELERERAARDDADTLPPMRVVDFGAGSGNLILPLSKCFPDMRFTAVEMKRRSAELLERRAAAAGLTNVDVVVDMIEKTSFDFDVGVALHACGNATDFTIARCLGLSSDPGVLSQPALQTPHHPFRVDRAAGVENRQDATPRSAPRRQPSPPVRAVERSHSRRSRENRESTDRVGQLRVLVLAPPPRPPTGSRQDRHLLAINPR